MLFNVIVTCVLNVSPKQKIQKRSILWKFVNFITRVCHHLCRVSLKRTREMESRYMSMLGGILNHEFKVFREPHALNCFNRVR